MLISLWDSILYPSRCRTGLLVDGGVGELSSSSSRGEAVEEHW